MKIAVYTLCALYLIMFVLLLLLSKKPFKYLFLNAVCGWWCFITVNLLSFVSGIYIPVNWNNIILNGILGIPGTVLLMVLKYCIFI